MALIPRSWAYIQSSQGGEPGVHDPPDLTQAPSAKVSGEDADFTHTQLLPGAGERKRSHREEPRQRGAAGGLCSNTSHAFAPCGGKRTQGPGSGPPAQSQERLRLTGGAS